MIYECVGCVDDVGRGESCGTTQHMKEKGGQATLNVMEHSDLVTKKDPRHLEDNKRDQRGAALLSYDLHPFLLCIYWFSFDSSIHHPIS